MAIEIKSNVAVIDLENKFPYATKFGETFTKELNDYVNNSAMSSLTQTEYDALDDLIIGFKSLNVWDSITEFLPLIGDTIDAQIVKLKSKSNTLAEKFNNISNSYVDGKGLNYTTQVTTNAKGVKLGITNMDVHDSNTGFGVISYFKNNAASVVHPARALFGLSSALVALTTNDFGVYFNNTSKVNADIQFNSTPSMAASSDTQLYFSKIVWNASKQISQRLFRANGTQLLNSLSVVNITTPSYEDFLLLGCQKVKDSATNGGYGWVGNIRLFIMHDGTIPEAVIPQMETLLNAFITTTGKTL